MNKTLAVHSDNIIFDLFDDDVFFDIEEAEESVDGYISKEIISEIKNKDFNKIFIKDNLSNNYLELLGIRVAYHIRLSQELGEKRFLPIIILSDVDEVILNKLEPLSRILFTKNVFLIPNTKKAIEDFQTKDIPPLNDKDYHDKFLNKIEILPPQDYLTHHSIANEWSIYKWSKILNIKDSEAVNKTVGKIKNLLYFKYLKELNKIEEKQSKIKKIPKRPKEIGKVLLIDDEWDRGWKDIIKKALDSSDIEFDCFEYDYKDKSNFNLIVQIKYKELKEKIKKADVVILDLRLIQQDHENDDMENYSGIKILKKIHEINAGIQVIMLTATSKSIILEKLYEYKILGYIKKEHPDDKSISTIENINKFVKLVDKGLEGKYLKEIWNISIEIGNILDNDPFKQYIEDYNKYRTNLGKLKKEKDYIFDILDTNQKNKINYALISLATSIDAINDIFIEEKYVEETRSKNYYYLDDNISTSLKNIPHKIAYIIKESGYIMHDCNITCYEQPFEQQQKCLRKCELEKLNKKRNQYIHSNPNYVMPTKDQILKWYKLLRDILKMIRDKI